MLLLAHSRPFQGVLSGFGKPFWVRTITGQARSGVSWGPFLDVASYHRSSSDRNRHVMLSPRLRRRKALNQLRAEDRLYEQTARKEYRGRECHVDIPLWTNCLISPHGRDSLSGRCWRRTAHHTYEENPPIQAYDSKKTEGRPSYLTDLLFCALYRRPKTLHSAYGFYDLKGQT